MVPVAMVESMESIDYASHCEACSSRCAVCLLFMVCATSVNLRCYKSTRTLYGLTDTAASCLSSLSIPPLSYVVSPHIFFFWILSPISSPASHTKKNADDVPVHVFVKVNHHYNDKVHYSITLAFVQQQCAATNKQLIYTSQVPRGKREKERTTTRQQHDSVVWKFRFFVRSFVRSFVS